MDVSIIIVNYHTSKLIFDCVKTISRHTSGISYEVIILDNASEPDFQRVIESAIPKEDRTQYHYISLSSNLGFGKANNEGLRYAKGRNILFLNPDTLLVNNAVKILSDFLDNYPRAGACGGNLLDNEERPGGSFWRLFPGIVNESFIFFSYLPFKLFFGKNVRYNHGTKPLKVAFITGADLMVKREVLDLTGSFSPEFFMFYEEVDLCARIRKMGYGIYSVPQARIIHLEGASFGKSEYPGERRIRYMEEGRKIFLRRNRGKIEMKASNFIYQLYLIIRKTATREKNKKIYYSTRLEYLKARK